MKRLIVLGMLLFVVGCSNYVPLPEHVTLMKADGTVINEWDSTDEVTVHSVWGTPSYYEFVDKATGKTICVTANENVILITEELAREKPVSK